MRNAHNNAENRNINWQNSKAGWGNDSKITEVFTFAFTLLGSRDH